MLDPSQSLLLKEARKRKIKIDILVEKYLYLLSYKNHKEYLCHQFFGKTSSVGYFCCKNKSITKFLLKKNGLQVPSGKTFKKNQFVQAQHFVSKIGYPIVMKPSTGLKGYCVFPNTKNSKEFKINWNNIFSHYHELMIEKQMVGNEYRLLASSNIFLAATQKVFIKKHPKGEESHRDLTRIVHPFYRKLAMKIIKTIPELSYGGIDLIAKDITKAPNKNNYAILEINASPDISIHDFPRSKIAEKIIDTIFPETKN